MRWRTVGRVAGTVLVALAVPGAVAAAGIAGARGEVYTAREPGAPSAPVDDVAAPTHDPGKPTAVILLGSEGANAADVLAPYEVLATTGAFNLYTVAPQRQPVPLTGNLDLVPDLSLGQLDQRLPTGPEVIVVPQLSEVASGLPPSVAPVIAWLQRQRAQGDPLLVSVCVGAQVPAEAGLLDGRPTIRAGRQRSGSPGRHPPTWSGCSQPATGGTARAPVSCSPTASARSSWPRRSGPTPSCRTRPAPGPSPCARSCSPPPRWRPFWASRSSAAGGAHLEETMQRHTDPVPPDRFPTDPTGLPEAGRPQLLELGDGDTLDLRVGPVAKRLGETMVRMLGYNGSVPGPILKVGQGSEIIV